mmetsp:Transcript_8194/g.24405  ORF Transcript_8194/g.24405 Transcript_8194/m.24405 type:complete len:268 (-) Transcript_8194:2047-2850(-)
MQQLPTAARGWQRADLLCGDAPSLATGAAATLARWSSSSASSAARWWPSSWLSWSCSSGCGAAPSTATPQLPPAPTRPRGGGRRCWPSAARRPWRTPTAAAPPAAMAAAAAAPRRRPRGGAWCFRPSTSPRPASTSIWTICSAAPAPTATGTASRPAASWKAPAGPPWALTACSCPACPSPTGSCARRTSRSAPALMGASGRLAPAPLARCTRRCWAGCRRWRSRWWAASTTPRGRPSSAGRSPFCAVAVPRTWSCSAGPVCRATKP